MSQYYVLAFSFFMFQGMFAADKTTITPYIISTDNRADNIYVNKLLKNKLNKHLKKEKDLLKVKDDGVQCIVFANKKYMYFSIDDPAKLECMMLKSLRQNDPRVQSLKTQQPYSGTQLSHVTLEHMQSDQINPENFITLNEKNPLDDLRTLDNGSLHKNMITNDQAVSFLDEQTIPLLLHTNQKKIIGQKRNDTGCCCVLF